MDNAELLQAMQQLLRAEVEPIKEMVRQELEPIKERLTGVEDAMASNSERLATLEANMGQRLTKVEITLENDISTKINLMYEGHQEIIRKLDKVIEQSEQVDDTLDRVSTLETVVMQHSNEIKHLKKAN